MTKILLRDAYASHEMYARPEIYEYAGKKYRVPKVLLSGNHKLNRRIS